MLLPNAELCLIVGVLSALLGYGIENLWKKKKISLRLRRLGVLASILLVLISLLGMASLMSQKFSNNNIFWDEKVGKAKIMLNNLRPVYRYGLAEPVALGFGATIGPIAEEPMYKERIRRAHPDCLYINAISITEMAENPLLENIGSFSCARKSSTPQYWIIDMTALNLNEQLIRNLMKLNEYNKRLSSGDLPQFCIGPEIASAPKIPAKSIVDKTESLSIRWNYARHMPVTTALGQTHYEKDSHVQITTIPLTPEIRDALEKLRNGYEQLTDANLQAQGYSPCNFKHETDPSIHCYCKASAP